MDFEMCAEMPVSGIFWAWMGICRPNCILSKIDVFLRAQNDLNNSEEIETNNDWISSSNLPKSGYNLRESMFRPWIKEQREQQGDPT